MTIQPDLSHLVGNPDGWLCHVVAHIIYHSLGEEHEQLIRTVSAAIQLSHREHEVKRCTDTKTARLYHIIGGGKSVSHL